MIITLARGQELITALTRYAKEEHLLTAWIHGLGAASEVTLGFYDLEARQYHWQEYPQPLEILHLEGNLCWVEEAPFWHIHGSFATADFQTIGGHIKTLTVSATCELQITPENPTLTRRFDEQIGLKLLDN